MTHRIVLVGGTPIERGRVESSLRNVGASVLAADTPAAAALLGRQFGPSVVVLLENPTLPAGRQKIALLLNQPGTAVVPLVASDSGVSDGAGVTLLRSLVGLIPCNTGGEILEALTRVFGDDPQDLRRRLTWQRRGPVTLRRIGDFLRARASSGDVIVDNGGDGGFIRLHKGKIVDVSCGALRGSEAIRALLQSDDDQPWGVSFRLGAAVASNPGPTMAAVPGVLPSAQPSPSAAATVDVRTVAPAANVAAAVPTVDMSIFDDVAERAPRGLPPLRARHEGPVPMRVVLIDDDPALVLLYQRTFSHAGHDVTVANDGEAGIAAATRLMPDVIVSDIAMPGKNGWDVLAAVRADPRLAETPMVLLSCHGDFLSGLKKASAGANDYIEKGIRAAALLARIEEAAATRRRLLSWGDEVPPSFSGRLADVGLFALLTQLERSHADGEVRIDDGWITIRLLLSQGELVAAAAQEADGTVVVGEAALAAAIHRLEADVEFICQGDEHRARAPSRRLQQAAPSGRFAMGARRRIGEALLHAAFIVEDERRQRQERVIGDDGKLLFKDSAADVYFLVADEASERIARQFKAGLSPKLILELGQEDPIVVESVVSDLLSKGVAELLG